MNGNGYSDLRELLDEIQKKISREYSDLITDRIFADGDNGDERMLLRTLILKYLNENGCAVSGMTREEIASRLFSEMAEYSVLTPYLSADDLEEININSWNDIALTYRDGRIVKAPVSFFDPAHAEDVIKRLLRNSGMIIDGSSPISQGHLPGNNRITAIKSPVVDGDCGIAASIRLLHNADLSLTDLVKSGMATPEMVSFLRMLCRYGVSFVVAGATSSGKTTLLNAILSDMPEDKRIFTIESGARELSLVRENACGKITNNVVHTLSRPSDSEKQEILQEDLVVASLRFNPDIVCVGEMRDVECYAAVEAAMTGHTVVSTVHSGAGESAHVRIALLCQKKFPIDFSLTMLQAAEAFPVIVYCGKVGSNKRRVIDISECIADYSTGKREYRTLFRYDPGTGRNDGAFTVCSPASDKLRRRLEEHGAPSVMLDQFYFGKMS